MYGTGEREGPQRRGRGGFGDIPPSPEHEGRGAAQAATLPPDGRRAPTMGGGALQTPFEAQ